MKLGIWYDIASWKKFSFWTRTPREEILGGVTKFMIEDFSRLKLQQSYEVWGEGL